MLLLYILILINQIIAYGALIYLATNASGGGKASKACEAPKSKPKQDKKQAAGEETSDKSGKYLDYINKFEVEA